MFIPHTPRWIRAPAPLLLQIGLRRPRGSFSWCPRGRPARWVRTIARVTFVLLLLALVPFLLAGPYGAIGWAGTYLVPVVVVSLVLGCAFGPLVWVALKLDRWGQEIH